MTARVPFCRLHCVLQPELLQTLVYIYVYTVWLQPWIVSIVPCCAHYFGTAAYLVSTSTKQLCIALPKHLDHQRGLQVVMDVHATAELY